MPFKGCSTTYNLDYYENTKHVLYPEQFIGSKDKNDIEIYEGDTVQIIHNPCSTQDIYFDLTGEVIYQESCSRFIIKMKSRLIRIESYLSELTVIGNIHENMDLLK